MKLKAFSYAVHVAILASAIPTADAVAQTVKEFSQGISSNRAPISVAAGPDGNLWFTEEGQGAIGRITASGAVTEFAANLQSGSIPFGITPGPDGNLWFTDNLNSSPAVGRISPAGVITEFFQGLAVGNIPLGIATGSDGNIWFADESGAVGRVTTSGSIVEFSQGLSAKSAISDITAGPDGNLWFTNGNGHIGRIVPATGQITEFSVGLNAGSQPAFIKAGPDGNLWFTDAGTTHALGRVTTAGVISEFTAGLNASSQPFGITAGPDGNVWFSDNGTTKAIGRVTPQGVSTEFSQGLDSGSVPLGITLGPDGNLWFTDEGTPFAIGRLTPSTAVATDIVLVSSLLPTSRSVQVGATATAFATMINASTDTTAISCQMTPATTVPASFFFQATNPSTNQVVGSQNAVVTIAAGAAQSFVFGFTPTSAFAPGQIAFNFTCANAPAPAITVVGVNTLLLSASTTPTPDIIALVASNDPGVVDIPGASGTGAFAIATVNVGAASTITASANLGGADLPISLSICETVPATGACVNTPAAQVITSIANSSTPTFAVFVQGDGVVPFQPAANRVFVQFRDAGGAVRGSTSLAVRTQ